jgi:hypothetical protein
MLRLLSVSKRRSTGTQRATKKGTQGGFRGTQGTRAVVGCTLWYLGVYTHARAHSPTLSGMEDVCLRARMLSQTPTHAHAHTHVRTQAFRNLSASLSLRRRIHLCTWRCYRRMPCISLGKTVCACVRMCTRYACVCPRGFACACVLECACACVCARLVISLCACARACLWVCSVSVVVCLYLCLGRVWAHGHMVLHCMACSSC